MSNLVQWDRIILCRLVFMVVGSVLVGAAGLVSNSLIERTLLNDPSRTLAWGPSLFRVLLAGHGLVLVLIGVIWRRNAHDTKNSRPLVSNAIVSAFSVEMYSSSSLPWIVLSGLSILALGLRLWQLDSDLWFDEVLTLLDFVRPPLGEIVTSFPSQNQHMLYSVLGHISISIFGESAWALRLPSVVFGVGSLWALFLLGRRVIGTREALLACTLMTVSYHHIWFAQNARGYMGLLFFATLATWLWLEALSQNTWRWWMSYAVVGALGMWTHMTMAFVMTAHGLLYLLLLMRPMWGHGIDLQSPEIGSYWKPIVAWLLCGSVTVQLYALSLPEFLRTALHEVSLPSEWTNPLWVVTESLRSLRIGFSGVIVVLCGGVLAGVGWLSILCRNWLAGVSLILPALLAGATMLTLGHNLWPRFFFFSMGFALLIAVYGAMTAPQILLSPILSLQTREDLTRRIGVILTCLMIIASMVTVPRYYALPKQDFSGARDYVEQNRKPGDAVVAVGLAGVAYGRYFAPHWSVVQTQAELDLVRYNHSTVWLVYTLPIEVKAYRPEIWKVVVKDFEVVRVFPGTLGGGEMYVCRQRSTNKEASNVSAQTQTTP